MIREILNMAEPAQPHCDIKEKNVSEGRAVLLHAFPDVQSLLPWLGVGGHNAIIASGVALSLGLGLGATVRPVIYIE